MKELEEMNLQELLELRHRIRVLLPELYDKEKAIEQANKRPRGRPRGSLKDTSDAAKLRKIVSDTPGITLETLLDQLMALGWIRRRARRCTTEQKDRGWISIDPLTHKVSLIINHNPYMKVIR